MSFWHFLQQNWPELLQHLREHLWLVFISTLIAVAIGIPTGILLTRKKSLRSPVLGIANVTGAFKGKEDVIMDEKALYALIKEHIE